MAIQGTVVHRPWVSKAAGLVLVVVGIFFLKTSFFDVLAAARNQAPEVSLSFKAVLLAPLFIILGLAVPFAKKDATTGWQARLSNPVTKRLSPLGYVIVLAILAIGAGMYFWLKSQLTGLGYDV